MVLTSKSMKGQTMSKLQETNSAKIQQILDELEHPEPIVASPWFHTRVMQRIQDQENQSEPSLRHPWCGRWLRPALLGAMIVLNVTIMSQVWRNWQQGTGTSEQSTRGVAILAAEYGYDLDSDFWAWSEE